MPGTSGPSGLKVKKKLGEQEEASGPNVKKVPGGQNGGNQKPTSEGDKVGMMVAIGGWSSAEELASSKGVGLTDGVQQSRMQRAYTHIASPITRYRLLRSGMTACADTLLPAFVCRYAYIMATS